MFGSFTEPFSYIHDICLDATTFHFWLSEPACFPEIPPGLAGLHHSSYEEEPLGTGVRFYSFSCMGNCAASALGGKTSFPRW